VSLSAKDPLTSCFPCLWPGSGRCLRSSRRSFAPGERRGREASHSRWDRRWRPATSSHLSTEHRFISLNQPPSFHRKSKDWRGTSSVSLLETFLGFTGGKRRRTSADVCVSLTSSRCHWKQCTFFQQAAGNSVCHDLCPFIWTLNRTTMRSAAGWIPFQKSPHNKGRPCAGAGVVIDGIFALNILSWVIFQPIDIEHFLHWIGFNLLSLHRVQVHRQRHVIYTFINPQGEISSLHLTHPSSLRSSGLRWCAREATGGSVTCSRTLRLATNGESGDRTHDLAVAGRPPYPHWATAAGEKMMSEIVGSVYIFRFSLSYIYIYWMYILTKLFQMPKHNFG